MRADRIVLAGLLMLAMQGRAFALEDIGSEARSGESHFGLGVETTLVSPLVVALGGGPTGGLALSYDAFNFRIEGLLGLGFEEDVATAFLLGGRFFYVINRGRVADFSIGGGLALGFVSPARGMGDSTTRVELEGAGQARVFLASNFALTGTLGLGLAFGKGHFVFELGGQLVGGVGLIYYF